MKQPIDLFQKTILVTGAAGFIGAALIQRLLACGMPMKIVGVDSINDYYTPALKEHRLQNIQASALKSAAQWLFLKGNIADTEIWVQILPPSLLTAP